MDNINTFEYNYSAERAREVEAIRRKYEEPKEDKFEQLKALDRQAERRGQILSIAIGIIGTLILGTGMSMVMVGQVLYFIPGVVIGIVGALALGAAYPIYKKVTQKDRDKVAGQVLALVKQLQ
ncbi:MAG: hypothetical protein J6I68_01325 [Butyrivibrio sp.]|uniref:hypothetical protein n=1 Tax=Butyrivibrio sp. TaxID=28121 RepID=UPI001B582A5E|nr:hypothetical protein [Butyrivibrio sp.]MBP3781870.1 hypothetical protein [Butyrivibrio sp.]MBP3813259.1 hypothetical protein [Butyrivibrio sp.]